MKKYRTIIGFFNALGGFTAAKIPTPGSDIMIEIAAYSALLQENKKLKEKLKGKLRTKAKPKKWGQK